MTAKKIWQPKYQHQDFKLLSSPVAYEGYLKVHQCQVQYRLFEGGWSPPVPRELVKHGLSCAAILYDPDQDEVVLIEQMRMGAIEEKDSPWLLEPVAGMVDENETPEQTIVREAKEESGCEVLDLIYCTEFIVSPGISTERTKIYCAKVKAPKQGVVYGLSEEGEDIKVHVIPAESAIKLIETLPAFSATTIISLQWFALNYNAIRKKWVE